MQVIRGLSIEDHRALFYSLESPCYLSLHLHLSTRSAGTRTIRIWELIALRQQKLGGT